MQASKTNESSDLVLDLSNAMEVVSIPDNSHPHHHNDNGNHHQQQQQQQLTQNHHQHQQPVSSTIAETGRVETIDMSDLPSSSTSMPPAMPPPMTTPTREPEPRRPLVTPDRRHRRPFDLLGQPPADPIPFDRAQFQRGRRDDVLCYNAEDDSHTVLRNVLFRDYSREIGGESRVQLAYYPMPYRVPIKTIMGHVEICIVLERCKRQRDDLSSDNSSDSDSEDDEEEDDDIVFQWTDRRVAVKVNSCATMERLRGRHAEDPLKEIAAMQLIGNQHENVLGCIEALFDGQNLNVVMDYCDTGDLFQLLQDTQAANSGNADAPPGLSEGQARYWFRQVIKGVQYMHEECGVCHRDLSPENVMIDGHRRGVVIDMGMCLRVPYQVLHFEEGDDDNSARLLQVTDLQTANQQHGAARIDSKHSTLRRRRCLFKPQGTCGKMPYMSPEIYRNRDPFDGEAADIWTSGTILFCMVTGNRSYQRPHPSDPQFYWMTHGIEQLLSDWNVRLSEEGLHLLKNMLQIDPRVRLTLDEVVNHPWFDMPDEEPGPPPPEGGMEFDLDLDD